jgi:hypothetical protein
MALSNWSSIGYNTKGKECIAEFEWEKIIQENPKLAAKYFCDIYKNWIKIGNLADKEIAVTMQSGDIHYGSVHIYAKRGKKDERRCFFIIENYITDVPYNMEIKDWKKQPGRSHKEFMAGIGTYAFTNSGREVGITKDCKKEFIGFLKEYGFHCSHLYSTKDKKLKNKRTGKILFTDDKDFTKWFNKVKASKNKKYNQGTLYFAKHGIKNNPLLELGKKKHAKPKKIDRSKSYIAIPRKDVCQDCSRTYSYTCQKCKRKKCNEHQENATSLCITCQQNQ